MARIRNLLSLSFIFSLAALGATPAHATQPLSDFIARSKSQSFDSRESTAIVEQRKAESDAALGRVLPVFSARGVYTRNQRQVIIPITDTVRVPFQRYNVWDAYFQVDVPIIDLANYYRYKSTRALEGVSVEQIASTQLDVSRSVTRAYYSYLGATALVNSARLSTKVAEDNAKIVEDRRNAGVATDLDRERAVANVELTHQQVADAELSVDLAARTLETLSGLTPTPAEGLAVDDLHEEPAIETWFNQAQNSPQDRVAAKVTEATRLGHKAAQYALLPTLSASASEHLTNSGIAGKDNYLIQVTAAVRLDYTTWANARAQAAATNVAQIRQDRARRAVDDSVFQAFRTVQAGIVKSRAARAQASAAKRAAELASERYVAGATTQLDVTQAQRDAFSADASRIQADAELAYARAALRIAAGRDDLQPGINP